MEENFKRLNDVQHLLLRPTMYIGKITEEPTNLFIFGEYRRVSYIPALLKLVNELIDNSNDEHLRSGRKFATKIDITMTSDSFKIEDNGRGIEVAVYGDGGIYKPQIAWCEARAGSSFSENRVGAGSHGIGSFATNVFSKKFIGISCDGKKRCTVTCTNNLSTIDVEVDSYKGRKGTSVYFEPDFTRFGTYEFSPTDIDIIKSRIEGLAVVYPTITYTFNGEVVSFKNVNDFLSRFGSEYVKAVSSNGVTFGIFPSKDCDAYSQYSIIDGLEFVNGGSHEAYVSREICYALRDAIKKKHKIEMSPAEIKRGLMLVTVGANFANMLFDSQTKERLTNSEAEVKAYLGAVNFEKLAKDIMGIPEIIDPIIEAKLAKQIAAEKRAVTLAQKKMAKKYVEKHLPAKSKNVAVTTLLLTEGDSAKGMGEKVRNIEKHGFFPLRGMPLNTYGVKEATILENKELNNIMSILGLKFKMSESELDTELNYGKIGLLADRRY